MQDIGPASRSLTFGATRCSGKEQKPVWLFQTCVKNVAEVVSGRPKILCSTVSDKIGTNMLVVDISGQTFPNYMTRFRKINSISMVYRWRCSLGAAIEREFILADHGISNEQFICLRHTLHYLTIKKSATSPTLDQGDCP